MFSNNKNNICKIYPEVHFDRLLRFDGASKSNPGIAGAGAVIYCNNTEVEVDSEHKFIELWSQSKFLGERTNNQAEYEGLILGLNAALELGITKLLVQGDSLLIINHMKGVYKCKSENLIPLYKEAMLISKKFETITFEHILRKFNTRADELANIGVEEYYKP